MPDRSWRKRGRRFVRLFNGIFLVLSRWRARTPSNIAGALLLPAAGWYGHDSKEQD
jgi:hypothetical protein